VFLYLYGVFMYIYVYVYMCVCDAAQTVVMSSLKILYFLFLSLLIIVLSLKALLCCVSFICVEQEHSWVLGCLIIEVSRVALPKQHITNTKRRTSISSPTIPRIRLPQT